MSFYRRHGKRWLDIGASAIGLVVLSPVLAAVALSVLIALGRPVLFTQVRPGRNARPFRVYKFRTMPGTAADGPDEARLTAFGRALRSTSLDELPELFNVLRGDMSLVGPRPLLVEYLPLYSAEQARRHEIRPGITGWAQVNGRNAVTWPEKLRFDVWYVDNLSFGLDVGVLLRTLRNVLSRAGVTQPGHATSEPFRGER